MNFERAVCHMLPRPGTIISFNHIEMVPDGWVICSDDKNSPGPRTRTSWHIKQLDWPETETGGCLGNQGFVSTENWCERRSIMTWNRIRIRRPGWDITNS